MVMSMVAANPEDSHFYSVTQVNSSFFFLNKFQISPYSFLFEGLEEVIGKRLPNKEEVILPGRRMGANTQRKSMSVPTVRLSTALERRAFTVQ